MPKLPVLERQRGQKVHVPKQPQSGDLMSAEISLTKMPGAETIQSHINPIPSRQG